MRLFHRTTAQIAADILADGFGDYYWRPGPIDTPGVYGVWLSDVPLGLREGAAGDALVEVQLALDEIAAAAYERTEGGKGYRQWFMPAELVNKYATSRAVTHDDNPTLPGGSGA